MTIHWTMMAIRFVLIAIICLMEQLKRWKRKWKFVFRHHNSPPVILPTHIAFALRYETDMERLASLVTTCYLMGIRRISVYRFESWNSDLSSRLAIYCTSWLPETEKEFTLTYLSRDDSICFLVNAVQQSILQLPSNSRVNDEQLLSSFNKSCCVDEVDLLVVFGDHGTVVGYPPFCLSWAEIHVLPPLSKVTKTDMLQALYEFSNKERRFGK
ncbi:hypothetical protein TTRE_0000928301 [Trichuris trichiura]|uniref:ditrans,polycis-polyprenyl diphosphate synthase [(2E,6E)-farnesyldiphosphate specific] n=1 Tax=Trichuris trichiura TaxID=36087 RepID=A0A077ZMA3_TRITR|nr:hypothetical protein TTRE_0000928301 [Trichuris trichiura]